MQRPPSQSLFDVGANFFFAKYSFDEEPFCRGYHGWLAELYFDDKHSRILRAVIEAVGLAGLCNISYSTELEILSKQQYCKALAAMKHILDNPAEAVEDATLTGVILLILFEIVNFKTWDRYRCWNAHVRAAVALLELRGRAQFEQDRGGFLFVQSRAHILLACMQQCIAVPQAIVQSSLDFQTSPMRQKWQRSRIASPGSISEISFRAINLRAALNNGELLDHTLIKTTALKLDEDLETWQATLLPHWKYVSNPRANTGADTFLKSSRHVYTNNWIADAWNNWRALRIFVKQTIMSNEQASPEPDLAQIADCASYIRQLSTDICISVHSFQDKPRILAMIQPLYLVAILSLNTFEVRRYAVDHLRHIAESTGVLQAALLADTAMASILHTAEGD